MLSTVLKDRFGMDMACLLVCDGWPFVHFIQNGERIQTLRSPSVIHSVSGYADAEEYSILKRY